jgi:nucleotide-binding universal stress UspA family protein
VMLTQILVPLDRSDLAEVALPYAEELCGRLGSKITLLYVADQAEMLDKHLTESYLEKAV